MTKFFSQKWLSTQQLKSFFHHKILVFLFWWLLFWPVINFTNIISLNASNTFYFEFWLKIKKPKKQQLIQPKIQSAYWQLGKQTVKIISFTILSLVSLFAMIAHQAEGIMIIAAVIINFVVFASYFTTKIIHHQHKKSATKLNISSIDHYKQTIITFFGFLFLLIIVSILVALSFINFQPATLAINSQKLVDPHISLGWQTEISASIDKLSPQQIMTVLNQTIGALSFNGFVFIVGILMGLSFWWIGISVLIFLFINHTYQLMLHLIIFYPQDINSIGIIFALVIGWIIGWIFGSYLRYHLIYKYKLQWNSLNLVTSFFVFVSSLVLWSPYYFAPIYEWNWWLIFVGVLIGVLVSSSIIFYQIKAKLTP